MPKIPSSTEPPESLATQALSENDRLALRERALKSTFFFNKAVLGFNDLEEQPHLEMTEFIDAQNWKRRLLLAPRGTIKSWNVRGWEIQMAMRNPNIRILHVMSTEKLAIKASNHIDAIFRGNGLLHYLFPERIPDFSDRSLVWNIQSKTIPRKIPSDIPTFFFCGVGTKITGMHFDIIILDDFIEKEAADSEAVMEDAISWARNCEPLLESPKNGQILTVGTRWSLRDYYGVIQGDRTQKTTKTLFRATGDKRYMVMKRAAIENGEPFWPTRFPIDELAQIKLALESQGNGAMFYLWYMNDPVDDALCEFPRKMIRYYSWDANGQNIILNFPDKDPIVVNPATLRITMTVDPGFTTNKYSDKSAICVVGTHPRGWRINLYSWIGKLNPPQLVEKLFGICEQFAKMGNPVAKVAIEKAAGGDVLNYWISERQKRSHIYIPLYRDLKTSREKDRKHNAARAMIPYVAHGYWFTHERFAEVNIQLETWPNGTDDNWMDAFSYQPQIWGVPDQLDSFPGADLVEDEDNFQHNENEQRISGYGA